MPEAEACADRARRPNGTGSRALPLRGRKPKSTEAHKREGTYRGDRHGKRATAPSGVPDAPKALSDEAAKEWNRVVKLLAAAGLVAKLDRSALALYCQAWSDYWAAKEIIENEGWSAVGSTGNVIEHPAARCMRAAWDQCMRAAREFGLTPAARSSIKLGGGNKEESGNDDEAAFF
jgi:P27 family predicted phage terminase small subunit